MSVLLQKKYQPKFRWHNLLITTTNLCALDVQNDITTVHVLTNIATKMKQLPFFYINTQLKLHFLFVTCAEQKKNSLE